MTTFPQLKKCFDDLIYKSQFRVEEIAFSESQSWRFQNGFLSHKSGGFFRIAGVADQPFIEQREIGTLGFLLREGRCRELLLQAKIEPGNIGIVQIAPSCQATASNLSMLHGGSLPVGAEHFQDETGTISQSLQSEQGTRFLGKRNRNILKMCKRKLVESDAHRWMAVDEVLTLLKIDYLINTDARSVLVSNLWRALIDRDPFTRYQDLFAKDLAKSFSCPVRQSKVAAMRDELNSLRLQRKILPTIPLDQLASWEIREKDIVSKSGRPFRVKQIRVRAYGREVSDWDQPIIDSVGEGLVDLEAIRVQGVLYFIFRVQAEDGLDNQVQLGPSFWIEPGEKKIENEEMLSRKVLLQARQSDEGGRFWQDSSLYRIIDLGERDDFPTDAYCLTLSEIQELLLEGEQFTNEARSVLALLLSWL